MSDFVLHFSRGEINQKLTDTRKLHVGGGYIHVSRKSYPSVDIRPYIAYRKPYIKFNTIDTHIEFSKYYSKHIYLDYYKYEKDNNLIEVLYWDNEFKKWILKLKEHPTKPSVTIKIIIKYLNPNTGQIENIPTRFWCLTYQGNIKFLNTVPPKEKHCISLLKYIKSISNTSNTIKIQLFNEHKFVLPKLYVEYYSNKNLNLRKKSVTYLTPTDNWRLTRKKMA